MAASLEAKHMESTDVLTNTPQLTTDIRPWRINKG
ncbi:hypothetical protein SAMN04488595_11852 [Ralstonia sp. 25mfcol4.1]|nr:hypothetical protein SAMN04488595_11852 [Ralstonia sp. 25mfcol4.1]